MQQIRGRLSHRESDSSEHTSSSDPSRSLEQIDVVQHKDKNVQTDKHRCNLM